jgi:hypothetical protein
MDLKEDFQMENPQSFEKRFSILQEISSVIAATKDINSLAYIILDRAISYMNADKGSLMLLNEKNELYILAARGFDSPFIGEYRVKVGEGIAGTIAEKRAYVLVEDIEQDQRFTQAKRDRYKTKSFISCSLISGDRLFGIININDKKDGSIFTEDELKLLKVIAYQAAVAFENAFLINQLKTKAAELEEINRKLIETDLDKTEFITRISHELRSPLNSVKGAIYYLQQSEKVSRNRLKEFYEIISKETVSLGAIIEDLLDFLRLENETLTINKSFINLSALLNEVSKSKGLKSVFTKKDIQLKVDIGNGISDIVGDKIKISQLFLNVMEGISHYLKSGDSMEITAHVNDTVKVDIIASRRLPDEVLTFLYRSKYIFYTELSDEEIRLYLAKRTAEAHGWSVEAENLDGTFRLSLVIPKSTQEKLETAITMSMDIFVEVISELLDLNICSIMLRDEITADLSIKGSKGLSDKIVRNTRINVGGQIAGWVAAEGKPLFIEDIEKDPRFKRKNIAQYNTKSLLSLPLRIHDQVIGVLNLNNKKTAEPFNTIDLYVAMIFSERVSHFLERIHSKEYSEEDISKLLATFENLLDAMKKYNKKKKLIPELVLRITEKLGMDEEEKKKAIYISMIYDLGLVSTDEGVYTKGGLSPSEKEHIKIHPYSTIGLLNVFEFSEDIKKIILHHHERYDGAGYPAGLRENEIPVISRVLSVVDSYYGMISEKSYRKSASHGEALSAIKAGSGTQYDPAIVRIFEEIFRDLEP